VPVTAPTTPMYVRDARRVIEQFTDPELLTRVLQFSTGQHKPIWRHGLRWARSTMQSVAAYGRSSCHTTQS
jgi:hypothetical protein